MAFETVYRLIYPDEPDYDPKRAIDEDEPYSEQIDEKLVSEVEKFFIKELSVTELYENCKKLYEGEWRLDEQNYRDVIFYNGECLLDIYYLGDGDQKVYFGLYSVFTSFLEERDYSDHKYSYRELIEDDENMPDEDYFD